MAPFLNPRPLARLLPPPAPIQPEPLTRNQVIGHIALPLIFSVGVSLAAASGTAPIAATLVAALSAVWALATLINKKSPMQTLGQRLIQMLEDIQLADDVLSSLTTDQRHEVIAAVKGMAPEKRREILEESLKHLHGQNRTKFFSHPTLLVVLNALRMLPDLPNPWEVMSSLITLLDRLPDETSKKLIAFIGTIKTAQIGLVVNNLSRGTDQDVIDLLDHATDINIDHVFLFGQYIAMKQVNKLAYLKRACLLLPHIESTQGMTILALENLRPEVDITPLVEYFKNDQKKGKNSRAAALLELTPDLWEPIIKLTETLDGWAQSQMITLYGAIPQNEWNEVNLEGMSWKATFFKFTTSQLDDFIRILKTIPAERRSQVLKNLSDIQGEWTDKQLIDALKKRAPSKA